MVSRGKPNFQNNINTASSTPVHEGVSLHDTYFIAERFDFLQSCCMVI